MIRNLYFRLAAILSVILIFACQDEDIIPNSNNNPAATDAFWSQYDFILSENEALTRVSYSNTMHSYFDEADEIGVFVVDDQGNLQTATNNNANIHYAVRTVTNLQTNDKRQVLVPFDPNVAVEKSSDYHYVLYYPYKAEMTLDQLKDYTHTVATDQSTKDAFEASDLLWCYYTPPTDTEAYEIDFDHAMAQIVLQLTGKYVPGEENEATDLHLLNMPIQAYNINLLQTCSDAFSYNSEPGENGIKAWRWGEDETTGDVLYRVCVPAHTITSGAPIVKVFSGSDNTKEYKLSADLTLKPGYTYTFTFGKSETSEIEISDEDSWLFDVYDPETNERVGLLCREYLRYQPEAGYKHTGDLTEDGQSKYINSQALVFYKLRNDGTPELKEGTVLRFTYDLQVNFSNAPSGANAFDNTQAYFPYPHENAVRQGMFLPEHGYYWTVQSQGNYIAEGKYGTELRVEGATDLRMNEQNYHMHGGTIEWGYATDHSYIKSFTLPQEDQYSSATILDGVKIGDDSGYITNKQAYYFGHIAIDNAGNASVSYSPIRKDNKTRDMEGNKVGRLEEHFLVDRRKTKTGDEEVNQYPLVKIGHNQFWMSKSLRTHILTNGTPITCYNSNSGAGVTFSPSNILDAGYVYPYSTTIKNNNGKNYDPSNNEEEMHPSSHSTLFPNMDFSVAPFYNKAAVENENFVPISSVPQLYYEMPTQVQMHDMVQYCGNMFAGKLSTNMVMKKIGDSYVNTYEGYSKEYYSALYGLVCDNQGNHYCANISGFNMKARGYFEPVNHDVMDLNKDAVIILKSSDQAQAGVDYFTFHLYNPFEASDYSKMLSTNQYTSPEQSNQLFGQVRLVMKFYDQLDNGGSGSSVSTNSILSTRSVTADKERTCNIYVPLMETE